MALSPVLLGGLLVGMLAVGGLIYFVTRDKGDKDKEKESSTDKQEKKSNSKTTASRSSSSGSESIKPRVQSAILAQLRSSFPCTSAIEKLSYQVGEERALCADDPDDCVQLEEDSPHFIVLSSIKQVVDFPSDQPDYWYRGKLETCDLPPKEATKADEEEDEEEDEDEEDEDEEEEEDERKRRSKRRRRRIEKKKLKKQQRTVVTPVKCENRRQVLIKFTNEDPRYAQAVSKNPLFFTFLGRMDQDSSDLVRRNGKVDDIPETYARAFVLEDANIVQAADEEPENDLDQSAHKLDRKETQACLDAQRILVATQLAIAGYQIRNEEALVKEVFAQDAANPYFSFDNISCPAMRFTGSVRRANDQKAIERVNTALALGGQTRALANFTSVFKKRLRENGVQGLAGN